MGITLSQVGNAANTVLPYPIQGPLVPGRFYLMENYRTSYFLRRKQTATRNDDWWNNDDHSSKFNNLPIDITGTQHGIDWSNAFPDAFYGPKERMLVLATGQYSLSERIWSLDFPLDEIYWDPRLEDINRYDPDHPDPHYWGKIYYRKDTQLNLEAPYDWRAVKYARYKLNSQEPSDRHSAWLPNPYVMFPAGRFDQPVITDPNMEVTMEQYHTFSGQQNRRIAERITNADKTPAEIPYGVKTTALTWCIPSVNNPVRFRDIKIGLGKVDHTIWSMRERNNIVIHSATEANDAAQRITIGDSNFRITLDGQGSRNNEILDGMENCLIVSKRPIFGSPNYVSTSFRDNQVGYNFKNNIIQAQFIKNIVGNEVQNNRIIAGNAPIPDNKLEGNELRTGFAKNEMLATVNNCIFASRFVQNLHVGQEMTNTKLLRENINGVEFKTVSYDTALDTFAGYVSLSNRSIDQNSSNFETIVVFPQSPTVSYNTENLNLLNPGFGVAGKVFLKPSIKPGQDPIATRYIVKSLTGAPTHPFQLVPVAYKSSVSDPIKLYWDWTLALYSINTKMEVPPGANNSYFISLATEYLNIHSVANDWVMLQKDSFLHQPSAYYFKQVSGQNNYFVI